VRGSAGAFANQLAEGHLDPQFIARAREETVKHPRGVIIQDRPAKRE
jgi:hypothetical protein